MSRRIVLIAWSGPDRGDAVVRLAKVFRIAPDRAAEVMRQVSEGISWEFERSIADRQVTQAEAYLRRLGFEVEWVSVARREAPPAEPQATFVKAQEELLPPGKEAPTTSWWNRLRKGSVGKGRKPAAVEPAPAVPPPPAPRASFVKPSPSATPSSSRWFLVPVFLLLAVVVALPYWVGMQVELKFSELPAQVYQSGDAVLINKNFSRGWLHSSADNLLEVATFKFKVHHEITHGPVLFDEMVQGNFADAPALVRVDSRITPDAVGSSPAALDVQTTIHLDGSGASRFNIPPAVPPATTFWQGLAGRVSFSAGQDDVRGSVTIRPFRGILGEKTLRLSPVRATATLQKKSAERVRRMMTLVLDRVSLQDLEGAYFLEGVGLDFSGQEVAGLVDFVAKLKVGSAGFEKIRYGPGSVTLKVRRLDVASIGKMRRYFPGLRTATRSAAGKQQPVPALLDVVLKQSPELEITELNLKTPAGEIVGHGKIAVDARHLDLPANPFSIFQSLNAEAVLTAPVATLKNGFASASLKQWAGAGLLVKKGHNYAMAVTFKNGRLAVNGRALGLSANKVKSLRNPKRR